MNEPQCSMPLLFGHGAEHVIRVHEVQEHEATGYVVDPPQEVLVGKPVCVLIEEIAPDRRCSRVVEPPCFTEASLDQLQRCRRRSSRRCYSFRNVSLSFHKKWVPFRSNPQCVPHWAARGPKFFDGLLEIGFRDPYLLQRLSVPIFLKVFLFERRTPCHRGPWRNGSAALERAQKLLRLPIHGHLQPPLAACRRVAFHRAD